MPASSSPPTPDALAREVVQLRRAVHELSILNDLARAVGGISRPDVIIDTIVKRSLQAIGAEQGVLSLLDDAPAADAPADDAHTFIRTGPDSAVLFPLRLDGLLLGWMIEHRAPLVVNDAARDPRFDLARTKPSVRSLLCVPLLNRGRMMGALAVFNKKDGTGFTDDDQRLLSIIAGQSAQVIENARLLEGERRLIQMRQEIEVARQIQTRLLPTRAPTVSGYDLAGTAHPAREVGGDYFDFIPLDGDDVGLCVGDVVGKGLPASLLMANVQATLRALAPTLAAPEACLHRANALLFASTSPWMFVTLLYGVLDPHAHTVTYANAGHNRPYLVRRGHPPEMLPKGGLMLAGVKSATYEAQTVALESGDVLVWYSDGLVEAMNAAREQYGDARLKALLAEHATHDTAADLVKRIERAAFAHMAGAPQADDLTLLVVRRS